MAQLKDNNTVEYLTDNGRENLTDTVLTFSKATIIADNTYAQVEYAVKKNEDAANNGGREIIKKIIEIPVINLIPNIVDATAIQEDYENLSVINEPWHEMDDQGRPIDYELRTIRLFIPDKILSSLVIDSLALVSEIINNDVPRFKNHIGFWIMPTRESITFEIEQYLNSLEISVQTLP